MKTIFNNMRGYQTDGRTARCITCRFDKHCTLKDPSATRPGEVIPLITNPDGSCQFYKISPWSLRRSPQCRIH